MYPKYPKKILIKILHDLNQIKYRTIVIVLAIAISVSLHIGTQTALYSINGTCRRLYQELHLSDLQFNFIPTTEDELPKKERLGQGIDQCERRLLLPGSIETSPDEIVAGLFIVLDEQNEPKVNQLKIMAGSYFKRDQPNSVLLDYGFAKEHGYRAGDKITLGLQGFFSEFRIAGLVVNAEFLVTSANPDYYLPVKGSLGIVYLPMKNIKEIFGYQIYNNFSLSLAKGADPQKIKSSLDHLFTKSDIELDSIFFQDDLFSVTIIKRDMRSFFIALPAIVAVFISVAFLILFFSFSRMIQQDMPQLGTLLAYGFSPFQLLSAYLTAGALLGLIGYLLGLAGSNLLANWIIGTYMEGSGLPLIFRFYSKKSFLTAAFFSHGLTMLAVGLPLMRPLSKKNVAEMLGRTIEKPGYFGKKNRITAFIIWPVAKCWNLILDQGAMFKMAMRNIWRRKIFFLLSSLAIILGLSLAAALLINNASIHQTINNFFTREQWDLFVPFTGLVEESRAEKLREIQGISKISLYRKALVTLQLGHQKRSYQLAGISLKNSLVRPDIVEGSFFSSETAKEIILNVDMKDQYGLRVGDLIEVWRGNREKERLTLVGLMNSYISGQAFVPLKIAQHITGHQDKFTGAFLKLEGSFERVSDKLYQIDFIGYVIRKDEARKTFNNNMKKISNFLYIYSLMSIFLSVCIIFVSLYLNIVSRESEYAVLQANGFGQREIGLIIIYEILAIVLIVITGSIPLTALMARFFAYKLAKAAISIKLQIRFIDYLRVFLPMLVLMSGVAFYCIRYALHIPITSTIRNRING